MIAVGGDGTLHEVHLTFHLEGNVVYFSHVYILVKFFAYRLLCFLPTSVTYFYCTSPEYYNFQNNIA